MIKQLWKPRYNSFQVYLKYFPIELQSIHFSGILKKISVFLRKNLVRLMCRRFFWNIFFQMKMLQEVHKTICSSKTISFRSFGIFTHWSPANTVTSLPQNGRFGQNFWWKISLGWCAADFSDRHSFRWKWFRTYLRPFVVQKQQVLGHMKYSPNDHQSIPLGYHQKISKNTKFRHIFGPRWPVEHIQQAIYAK